jgi:hypothetical protein
VRLYKGSIRTSGYHLIAQMGFSEFLRAVYLVVSPDTAWELIAKDGCTLALPEVVQSEKNAELFEHVVQSYRKQISISTVRGVANALDLLVVNDRQLQKIYASYANGIDRPQHVGRIPYLRFQSLLRAVEVFPVLISQIQVKRCFAMGLMRPLFGSAGKEIDLGLSDVQQAVQRGSLDFIGFVETFARVGVVVFSSAATDHERFPTLAAKLNELLKWVNKRIVSIAPSKILAENKRGNNVAAATFPSHCPLLSVYTASDLASRQGHPGAPSERSIDVLSAPSMLHNV